jgi:hypothetical protein
MSHFARIENNTVVEVIVAEQDFIDSGAVGDPTQWIQTSYTNSIRGCFAGVGYTYDPVADQFVAPVEEE